MSAANGGKLIAAGVPLYPIYGGTEFGSPVQTFDMDDSKGPDADVKTSADWAYMQFGEMTNCRWVPQGDGTYELIYMVSELHTALEL